MHLEKTNLPRLETLIKAYGAATIRAKYYEDKRGRLWDVQSTWNNYSMG